MSENLNNLETAVGAILAQESILTSERIRELIQQFCVIPTCMVDAEAAEHLARKFESRHQVTMEIGSVLTERDYKPWLDGSRASVDPYYWKRYKQLLGEKHFSSQVIASLDSVTDRILDLLENPSKDGRWDRRGMVVGHVQSGKTANYTGLICKAADAGYKLIVIIAGTHNNLRNQTQMRIDEGFIGRDNTKLLARNDVKAIGVGRFDSTRQPWTFTTSVRDFNKHGAEQIGGKLSGLSEPAVFVIKKNSNTLKNLLEWLRQHNARAGSNSIDLPILVIDDEADNASINTAHGPDAASRINGQIRELLRMFDRSCYVGYTATPFANIFIDPDTDDDMRGADLFPRSFIVSLDPPSNYFGADRVFLDEASSIIRHIDDNEDLLPLKHPISTRIIALPPSLIDAIRTFVIARAIRLARGHRTAHCSMLVNVSRFTNIQQQLRNEIHHKLERIQASVRVYGALSPDLALQDPEIAALHSVWQNEFSDTEFDWNVMQERLHDAAAAIRVVEVNSRSAGALQYSEYEDTGLNIIAVGGYSLSRGLTLEGLMVSYFLRNSMMYDTLMQMGRWFGYRPGYDDLCRVWMPEEAEGWYAHIAESIEMLREELRSMEAAGATPEEFGLKVRSHPDTLIVTARNKMGTSERVVVNIGLGNSFVETAILKRDHSSLESNREAARMLAEQLSAEGTPTSDARAVRGGWLLSKAPVNPVMDFLTNFQNHPGSMLTDPGPVRRYIEDRHDGELAHWDILFTSVLQSDGPILVDHSLGIGINCQRRTAGSKSTASTLRITNKQRVASRGIEKTGLRDEHIAAAEQLFRESTHFEPGEKKRWNFPDRIYREYRERPLLIVHLLKIDPEEHSRPHREPVVAWGISFPRTALEEKRAVYVVNTTWLRENFLDEIGEEEMGGDIE